MPLDPIFSQANSTPINITYLLKINLSIHIAFPFQLPLNRILHVYFSNLCYMSDLL